MNATDALKNVEKNLYEEIESSSKKGETSLQFWPGQYPESILLKLEAKGYKVRRGEWRKTVSLFGSSCIAGKISWLCE